MPIFQLMLISIIQGITEFLPISSSAHLILLPKLTTLKDQGVTIDVAVHIGTLFAVILYFITDIKLIVIDLINMITLKKGIKSSSLVICLIVATIPVILFGFIIKVTGLDESLRSVKIIAWAMLIFGIILYYTDQKGLNNKSTESWTVKAAVIMGFWQALALIPGTSRAGSTISGARLLGFSRKDSAKLSMLMSIPTIIASGTLLIVDIAVSGDLNLAKDFTFAILTSFLTALISIKIMMHFLNKFSYTPYVIYRVVFGLVLLKIAYS
ncbi:MAG: undecaprenyl-diphosphate phosphatase [Rhodobacteraceae bacterium]|nr:undecaprenyl-diphosphate phosphatase [Paracoccaceae bacterium]